MLKNLTHYAQCYALTTATTLTMPQFLIRFNTQLGLVKLLAIFHTTMLLYLTYYAHKNVHHFVLSWHIMAQIKSDGLYTKDHSDQHVNKSTNK